MSVSALETPSRPGSSAPGAVAWGYYWRILRTSLLWVVAGTVVGLLGAGALIFAQGKTWTATTIVQLTVLTSDSFSMDRAPSSFLDPGTEVQLARSSVTASRAIEQLGGVLTVVEMRSATTASLDQDGTILRISYTSHDLNEARSGADAVATSFLEIRSEQAQQRRNDVLETIDNRLSDLVEAHADALERQAEASPGSAAAASAESDREVARLEMDRLVTERTALSNVPAEAGTLLTPAADSAAVISPSRLRILVAGAMAGAFCGVVVAFLRDRLTKKLAVAAHVSEASGAAVWTPDLSASAGHEWDTAGELFVAVVPDEIRSVALISAVSEAAVDPLLESLVESMTSAGRQVVTQNASGVEELAPSRQTTDSPPPLTIRTVVPPTRRSDQLATARQADLVLIAVDLSSTRRDELTSLASHLRAVGRPPTAVLAFDSGRRGRAHRSSKLMAQ